MMDCKQADRADDHAEHRAWRARAMPWAEVARWLVALCGLFSPSVILAGQPGARIAFVGIWERAMPLVERAARETGIRADILREQQLLEMSDDADAPTYEVIYVLNLHAEHLSALVKKLKAQQQANPNLKIVALDQRDSHGELKRAKLLREDPTVPLYWRANGLVNMRRLLQYTAVKYLGAEGEIEPPVAIPDYGYYHPDQDEIFSNFDELKKRVGWKNDSPVAALLIQQSFWITEDTKVIDAQIRALEQAGFQVATLFAHRGEQIRKMLLDVDPDIVVEDRHGSIWEGEGSRTLLEELDVPYLRPISMLRYTVEQWREDPRGLAFGDVSLFMTIQEPKGTIEPIVVGGLKQSIRGFRLHVPIDERVKRFATRAARWLALRQKTNRQKRVAIVYYNRGAGKDDLMRGSPTGAFLDAPRSLVRFLPRLKERGYEVHPLPRDEAELLDWVRQRGRNIGPWAQGELEQLADQPDAILVPMAQFEKWMASRLSDAHREALQKHFGPPPGRLMVVTRNGQKHFVLPGIRLGNVLLACLPLRGEKQDEKLLHSRDVPPPYNYLAFYWWLEEQFKADAVVHWGTHGTVELLPGKEAGMSKDDWSDLCVGSMPVINPWIMDNLGEATLSRRRSYALLVDHMVPPATHAGLTDELRRVHDDIDKFATLEPGLLREEFRKRITQGVRETRIDETLKIESLANRSLTDSEIDQVAIYLHEVYNSTTPATLHVLGLPPEDERLASYLVSILRKPFLDRLEQVRPVPEEEDRFEGDKYKWLRKQAESLIRETVLGHAEPPAPLRDDVAFAREMLDRLNHADDEIVNLLRALEGHYVRPGPGPDPIRNPASIPSGRNLYALNPEEIPTHASWQVAVQLVDELLRTRHPRKVGIDLNGMNTMRDFGVMEAQILYLMGVRPVWDTNNLVIDVEIIPQQELQRPRVDVFIAMGGMYKENFPTRVVLLDKAVRLVSQLREKENFVRQGTEQLEQRLLARGFSEQQARTLAMARIFGTKPGNTSGTNILHLVPRSGVWKTDDDIAAVYIDNMSYVYTGDIWGEKTEGLYEEAIQGTDTLLRVWASNMTSQLSNHHAYEYLGGLSMAVKKLTGREPEAFIADVRDADGARLRAFEEVLATNLRTELLNRKWIEGMQQHDYAGAGMMAELVKNTFGWDVTRSGSVSDGVWDDIFATYIRDRYQLDMRQWFDRVNPHALQEIAATMLEAVRKGYWRAEADMVRELSRLYAESVVEHGPSAGLVSGGNHDLQSFVEQHLNAPGDRELAKRFARAEARASGAPASQRVYGPKLDRTVQEEATAGAPKSNRVWQLGMVLLIVVVFLVGAWRRTGAPD